MGILKTARLNLTIPSITLETFRELVFHKLWHKLGMSFGLSSAMARHNSGPSG